MLIMTQGRKGETVEKTTENPKKRRSTKIKGFKTVKKRQR